MSELLGSHELKSVSDCHPSLQSHLCEPSPDVLTSIIGNEYTLRLTLQQGTKLETELENLAENYPIHDDDAPLIIQRIGTFTSQERQRMLDRRWKSEAPSKVTHRTFRNPPGPFLPLGRVFSMTLDLHSIWVRIFNFYILLLDAKQLAFELVPVLCLSYIRYWRK